MMLNWIALACLIGAVALLSALSIVDLKTRLLPNEMVAWFATLGLVFHLTTLAHWVTPQNIALGAFAGFAALYLIRALATRVYGEDALGLGDVKLLAAAGVWLGPDAVMLAMALGALAGMVHGAFVALYTARKTRSRPDFARLQIPAGPGFAVGIIMAGIVKFWTFRP